MPTSKWIHSESEVERPYLISVDADIPPGCTIKVVSTGTMPGGAPWKEEYVNPKRERIEIAWTNSFSFQFTYPPGSIAFPFFYSIVIEGDRIKRTLPAEHLMAGNAPEGHPFVLMPAKNGRTFVTVNHIPGTLVSLSSVGRPWIVSLSAYVPTTCHVDLTLLVQLRNGQYATITVDGTQPQALPFTDFINLQNKLTFSGDGRSTPVITGFAIDGDGRRYFWPAQAMGTSNPPSIENFLRGPHPDNKAYFNTAQPVTNASLPPAINRLTEMFNRGEFKIDNTDSDRNVSG